MSDILQRIESYKREEIAAAKSLRPWNEVVAEAHDAPPVRRFLSALRKYRLEERWMRERFGDDYDAYRSRVKAIVPYLF